MMKLNQELGLPQPNIVHNPFVALKKMLKGINDIDDQEHFVGVKKRLEISEKQVDEAIEESSKTAIDYLEKEIINVILYKKFDPKTIQKIEIETNRLNNKKLIHSLANLYYNWGYALKSDADSKKGDDAECYYFKACNKYQKATTLNQNHDLAFNNWGNTLGRIALIKTGHESEKLYIQAFEKFEKVISINQNHHLAYYNWGSYLSTYADSKNADNAEKLYSQAFEKLKRVTEICPEFYMAYHNLAVLLAKLAKVKTEEELESYYQQVLSGQFEKGVAIKPDLPELFEIWATFLLKLANITKRKSARSLIQKAIEKGKKSLELGGSCYNLSCGLALLDEKKEAFHYLNLSLKNKDIKTDFVLNDEDWSSFLEDEEFKAIIGKYKQE
ncbi:hypothetical protein R9C00_20785 [Flammeovirgaceae bacterium SG7u.111]|nr:hypothetical protein [Flammeovirgaceae bacterium SG7u.132]WPO34139.1 hypothetical protein R9C00_20785 [Flammeovirgaceae bacterium SG7u.111]